MSSGEDPDLLVDSGTLSRLRWVRSSPQLVLNAENKLFKRLRCSLEKLFVPICDNQWKLRTIVARNFANSGAKGEELDCPEEKAIPLVMVHGFASGIGLWCKNIDSLALHRRVYAFDLLGFGRSSRPVFPSNAEDAENFYVESLEQWRVSMGLDKFILLGHSFGGYLSSIYAMKHSERVAHLILTEPWGYREAPFNPEFAAATEWKARVFRTIRRFVRIPNPLALIRASGPLGRSIFSLARHDLRDSFYQQNLTSTVLKVPSREDELAFARGALPDDVTSQLPVTSSAAADPPPSAHGDPVAVPENPDSSRTKPSDDDIFDGTAALDYAYHINVQKPRSGLPVEGLPTGQREWGIRQGPVILVPRDKSDQQVGLVTSPKMTQSAYSGEVAFKTLCSELAYAKRPLLPRIHALPASLPMTFIYGSRSWMDVSSGAAVREVRPNSYVDVKMIEGASHHVYAQSSEEFNAYINAIMHQVDVGREFKPTNRSQTHGPMSRLHPACDFSMSSALDTDSSQEDINQKTKTPSFSQPTGAEATVLLTHSDDAEDEASN